MSEGGREGGGVTFKKGPHMVHTSALTPDKKKGKEEKKNNYVRYNTE